MDFARADATIAGSGPATRPDTGVRSVGNGIKVQVGAKAVGSFVPKLTQKAFERYGFPAAALLTEWAVIAGRDIASFTAPERLKWPRRMERPDDAAGPSEVAANVPVGATMVLRVEGPRAIEVELRKEQLLERINGYFGFRAVTELRFVQAPLHRAAVHPVASRVGRVGGDHPRNSVELKAIGNPRLRSALERLGRAVELRGAVAGAAPKA